MNAKKEFIEEIKDKKVKCVLIGQEYNYDSEDYDKKIELKIGHSKADYFRFLDKLDFDYDDGYGGQNLYGFIWYTDDTFSSRGEYDGSEWWESHTTPEIPKELF